MHFGNSTDYNLSIRSYLGESDVKLSHPSIHASATSKYGLLLKAFAAINLADQISVTITNHIVVF